MEQNAAVSSSTSGKADFDPISDILGEDWIGMSDSMRVLAGKPTEAHVRQLLRNYNLGLHYTRLDWDQPEFNAAASGCQLYAAFQALKKESLQVVKDWLAKKEPPQSQKRKAEVLSQPNEEKVT